MTFKKVDNIRFIFKGKQFIAKVMFLSYMYNIIPIYVSPDVYKVTVIRLDNDELMVIINKSYEKINLDTIEVDILYNILKIIFDENKIIDIHIAQWFGFTKAINVINNDKSLSTDEKEYRIKWLENILNSNKYINIKSKQDLIKGIKFISIE